MSAIVDRKSARAAVVWRKLIGNLSQSRWVASRAHRDLVVVAVCAGLAALIGARLELSERVFAWTRLAEAWQFDELLIMLVVLLAGAAWFAFRRWRETQQALRLRDEVALSLEASLTEQRRLAQSFEDLLERERKQIARELHDELGQYIHAIKLDASLIRAQADCSARVDAQACAIVDASDHLYVRVSQLIRQLRPVGLDELGLVAAVEHSVDAWRARSTNVSLTLTLDPRIDGLSEGARMTLYRVVQEGLTNCARHARARHVSVEARYCSAENVGGNAFVELSVTDDGCGAAVGHPATQGLGLVGMRERVIGAGGTLALASAPDEGFSLRVRLPFSVPSLGVNL